jgi:hypothetical protein
MEEVLSKTEERMSATQAKTDGKLKELTETIEKTQTEPSPEMMQSVGEHQVVPREDAVVIPARGRKRRHRGRKQAAGRHGEPKELTRGDRGSQKKLAAASRELTRGDRGSRKKLAAATRKASRRATVAWTHGNCGPRKEVTAAGRKITRCAGQKRKVQNKGDVSPRSPKGGTFKDRCRTSDTSVKCYRSF